MIFANLGRILAWWLYGCWITSCSVHFTFPSSHPSAWV
jgi:hypothetical protein